MGKLKYYTLIFLLLTLVGLIVHRPSFNLSLYGDDWLAIYNCLGPYHTNRVEPGYTGPLPGILAYLTPYGPSNCLTGLLYILFDRNYEWYYVVSLFLKIFAAFSLFLLSDSILRTSKLTIFAFLSSILFLVGYTGIQNTDWAAYMIVYFATALFALSLLFKHKFLIYNKTIYLILSLLLVLGSLISSPVRLFPVIFILPIIDLLIIFSRVYRVNYLLMILSNFTFILSIFLLWLAGLFGAPGKIYSYGGWSISDFSNFVINQPLQAIKALFYWISIIIVPDLWFQTNYAYVLIGVLAVLSVIMSVIHFLMKRKTNLLWLMISLVMFFIFLLSMWYYAPSRLISSAERYLLLPFAYFCFFTSILSSQSFFSSIFKKMLLFLVILFLVVLHWFATTSEYFNLLSHGRDSKFIYQFDKLLFNNLELPVTSKNFIYLDFDNAFTQHSILFGLGMKILVLSKDWDGQNNPGIYDEKDKFFEAIKKEPSYSSNKNVIIKRVFAYQLKGHLLSDISTNIRKELLDYIDINKTTSEP